MLNNLFMMEALKQAKMALEKDEVPIGAVIVHNNRIIAKAYNQVETLKDPTAHAEMIAITQATNTMSSKWLLECSMFVTIEPCSMCAGALVLSRIKKLFFASFDLKTGACGSVHNIVQNNKLNHRIEVSQGILENECSELITGFFKNKRKNITWN